MSTGFRCLNCGKVVDEDLLCMCTMEALFRFRPLLVTNTVLVDVEVGKGCAVELPTGGNPPTKVYWVEVVSRNDMMTAVRLPSTPAKDIYGNVLYDLALHNQTPVRKG